MLQFGVCYLQELGQHKNIVIMKKYCLCGSEPETCFVVLTYVGISQSCFGAKQPKKKICL
jgi:hypothetical protein